jgi:hypothetical protein
MSYSLMIAVVSLVCIFGGALLGRVLQRLLPDHHMTGKSEDAVKVGAATIATMAALVLGLLVGSAKSNLDAANSAVTLGSAKIILLDRTLAHYGPETQPVREQLRATVVAGIAMMWPEERGRQSGLQAFEGANNMERVLARLNELKPKDELQQAQRSQAVQLASDLLLVRWQLIEQEAAPLPMPFLVVLLFWVAMLYTSYGLLAPRNATVAVVQFIGALSVAGAIFLILEMNRPLDGIIKVSSAPMVKALQFLDK